MWADVCVWGVFVGGLADDSGGDCRPVVHVFGGGKFKGVLIAEVFQVIEVCLTENVAANEDKESLARF